MDFHGVPSGYKERLQNNSLLNKTEGVPLVLVWGEHEAGKTHSVIDEVYNKLLKNSSISARYVKSSELLDEFLDGLKNKSINSVLETYRSVNILVIDNYLSTKSQIDGALIDRLTELIIWRTEWNKQTIVIVTADSDSSVQNRLPAQLYSKIYDRSSGKSKIFSVIKKDYSKLARTHANWDRVTPWSEQETLDSFIKMHKPRFILEELEDLDRFQELPETRKNHLRALIYLHAPDFSKEEFAYLWNKSGETQREFIGQAMDIFLDKGGFLKEEAFKTFKEWANKFKVEVA